MVCLLVVAVGGVFWFFFFRLSSIMEEVSFLVDLN